MSFVQYLHNYLHNFLRVEKGHDSIHIKKIIYISKNI
jgi:hypothetical protein